MPRTPEQYEEIRSEKKKIILDTALKLFAGQGYASTSISLIAEKAGISKGLMYNYFKSKEELLKIIVLNLIDEIIELLDSNHDNQLSEEEALQFFDDYFELLMKRTEEMKLYLQLTVQPEVVKYLTEYTALLQKSQQSSGLILGYMAEKHAENAGLAVMNLSAVLKGLMLIYVFSPEKLPDEKMLQYKEYLKNMFIKQLN